MIPIYKSELDIADKVRANASIAYTVGMQAWQPTDISQSVIDKAIAAFSKHNNLSIASKLDKDLYFSKSLFVTTNWNRNDDVFDPLQVWMARHTPSHKPTNIEHDENSIVGHMTDVWAVNATYDLIPDDSLIDDLPSVFHLINGSVIYRAWSNKDLAERAENLIAEIEAGKIFVSMEVLFNDFAYAVITPQKEFKVIARNQETSFLTKHLRAYGGSGEFDNHRIGRLMRNLTFSGKGYTHSPANPFSVVLNDSTQFDFAKASLQNSDFAKSGVSISISGDIQNTENSMSDFLENKNKELADTVVKLTAQIDELKQSQSKATVEALETKVKDLQGRVESLTSDLSAAKTNADALSTQKSDAETKLTAALSAKTEAESKLAKLEQEKALSARVAKLVDGGVTRSTAEDKVAKLSGLNDEQFNAVAEDIVKAAKPFMSKEDEEKEKKEKEAKAAADLEADKAAQNANTTVVDNATVNKDVALAADATRVNELENNRKSLASALAARLGIELKDDSNSK